MRGGPNKLDVYRAKKGNNDTFERNSGNFPTHSGLIWLYTLVMIRTLLDSVPFVKS